MREVYHSQEVKLVRVSDGASARIVEATRQGVHIVPCRLGVLLPTPIDRSDRFERFEIHADNWVISFEARISEFHKIDASTAVIKLENVPPIVLHEVTPGENCQ